MFRYFRHGCIKSCDKAIYSKKECEQRVGGLYIVCSSLEASENFHYLLWAISLIFCEERILYSLSGNLMLSWPGLYMLKNYEKCFFFHLKSSFSSQDI